MILEAKIFVTPAEAEVMKKKVVALKTKTEDLAESITKATGVEVSATVEDPEVLTNQTPLSEPILLKSAPTADNLADQHFCSQILPNKPYNQLTCQILLHLNIYLPHTPDKHHYRHRVLNYICQSDNLCKCCVLL